MVRDRLQEFLRKSNLPAPSNITDRIMTDSVQKQIGSVKDGDGNGSTSIEMDWVNDEISRFLSQVENLRTKAIALKADIEQVKVLQRDLLGATNRDEKTVSKLDSLMQSVKLDSRSLMAELKAMEKDNLAMLQKLNASKDTFSRIRKFQYKSLLKSFNDLLDHYQGIQSDYQEKCRTRLENMIRIKTGNASDKDGATDSLLENVDWKEMTTVSLFTDGYEVSTEQAKQDLYLANARLADLKKIEGALKDLHDLFMEMSGLVAVQGQQIDTIEKSVEDAVDFVGKGEEQLESAKKLQKQARKNKIRIIIILTVLALLLLVIIYFSI